MPLREAAIRTCPFDTILVPFTTSQIGGSHISGTLLAAGLVERFGVRAIVVAPDGAQVHDLARKLRLATMVSGDEARPRHAPHRDLLRAPARYSVLRGLGHRTVVHCNDLGALQAWAPAARLANVPTVYHNRAFDRDIWPNRLIVRLANHVISVSQACDARLGFLPAGRRSVYTNPFTTPTDLDSAPERARLLRSFGSPEDVRIVGFIGNFWRRKRPDFFVDVAARLADDSRLRFVMFGRAGDISLDEVQRRIAARGLSDKILLAGFRLPPEANLAALDLLLVPALAEPFGRTLVEAILLGVPYVAAADAGHVEIYARWGGGAVLPPDADDRAYAAACRSALRASEGLVLPLAARRAVSADLTPSRHAAEVFDVYRALVPDGDRHARPIRPPSGSAPP